MGSVGAGKFGKIDADQLSSAGKKDPRIEAEALRYGSGIAFHDPTAIKSRYRLEFFVDVKEKSIFSDVVKGVFKAKHHIVGSNHINTKSATSQQFIG